MEIGKILRILNLNFLRLQMITITSHLRKLSRHVKVD